MSFIPATFQRTLPVLLRSASRIGKQRCLLQPPLASLFGSSSQHTGQRKFHASTRHHSSTKNPYSVLGIDKSASASEIKKAYYSAAKKYHPDSSKELDARTKFQDVQAAYEILSDPQKKQQFDQFGAAGFDPSGAGSGGFPGGSGFGAGAGGFSGFGGGPFGAEFSIEDLFNSFGVGGGRKTGHRGPFSEEVLVGDDINVQTTVSFMDAAKGAQKEIRITPNVECPICSGSGTRPGTKKQECGRCGGTGTRVLFMQGGFQMATTCEACGGKGRVIPPGSECYSCHGSGVAKEKRTVTVEIPPGVEDGVRFRVSGEGHAPGTSSLEPGQSTKRGDLFVHIQVEPHEKFGRKGSDILYTSTIPMTTALLGGIIKIPTLDGEVELRVPSGTNTGDVIVMSTMGMKKLNLGRGRRGHGDLKVEFKVNMPKSLTPSQRTLLELLADEFRDTTAKRILNVGQFSKENNSDMGSQQKLQETQRNTDESHQGLLRRIWDKLTHHEQQQHQKDDDKKSGSA